MAPRPTILDVDTGVDDALALRWDPDANARVALDVAADECMERFVEGVRALVEASS